MKRAAKHASPVAVFLLCLFALKAFAQRQPDWTEPLAPHHVIGNVFYVGSKGLASYLITTPQGHILINSSMDANVPLIQESISKLGLRFSDVKILLISHAHPDHCGGSARVLELTGAQYMVMDDDVPVVESGGKADFQYHAAEFLYKPAKVHRVLHDGDQVKLGDTVLVARKTPGHTKGCTTWTMKAVDAGKTYDVVIVGSPNVNPGYKLVNNAAYCRGRPEKCRRAKTSERERSARNPRRCAELLQHGRQADSAARRRQQSLH